MQIIQTKTFKLATVVKGDINSDKVAILLPGRLDTKDYVNFQSHLDYLSNLGFLTVSFDPPGTWESPNQIGFTTTNYIRAVNELIEYYGNKPTFLFGHSRGGQTAILVSCLNDSVIGFAVVNSSFGPPTPPDPKKIKDGYLVEKRDLLPGDKRTVEKKEFYLSLEYFEDGQKYDCLPLLKKCTKPKLIMHGKRDEFNSLNEVMKIFNEIPDPKVFCELDTDHDYRLHAEVIDEVNKKIGEFVENYF